MSRKCLTQPRRRKPSESESRAGGLGDGGHAPCEEPARSAGPRRGCVRLQSLGFAPRAFGERFAVPQCDHLDTILNDRSVDAVLLLTPPNTHLELVSRCARAGKHVLLEKPLEIETARAEQLVRAVTGIKLGVVHATTAAYPGLAERIELIETLGRDGVSA